MKNKTLKRPNNAGSVYKPKDRRRNPWVAIVSHGYDKSGKRIRKPIGYFSTKSEALKAIALYDVNPTERPNVTLKEIYSEWSQEKYPQISKSTVDNYKACYLKLSSKTV